MQSSMKRQSKSLSQVACAFAQTLVSAQLTQVWQLPLLSQGLPPPLALELAGPGPTLTLLEAASEELDEFPPVELELCALDELDELAAVVVFEPLLLDELSPVVVGSPPPEVVPFGPLVV